MSHSQLATVLGHLPSGLCVLTLRHNDEETGMLISWVMQAGFEPPMVTVAIKQGRHVADWIAEGAPFVLNLLAENHKALIGHFGRGFERGEAALADMNLVRTADGCPALAESLGYLECRSKGHIDSADHRVFLAEVLHGHIAADGQPYVHIRKNGLRY